MRAWCYSLASVLSQLFVESFDLARLSLQFTPLCQHTLHHVGSISLLRCLFSWLALNADGRSTECVLHQVDYMLESLVPPWLSALHCLQQPQSGACSSSTTQPVSLTLDPNASSSSGPTPNLEPSLSSTVSNFTSGLTRDVRTQTVPLCSMPSMHHAATAHASTQLSVSEFLQLCFLPNTPSGEQFHFGCMKIFVIHRPPALPTQGKSRLLMPPRSSLLPSSSNGASSPKPSRRVLPHLSNPSTWVRLTVSAIPVVVGTQPNGTPPPPPGLEGQALLGISHNIPSEAAPVRPNSHHGPSSTSPGTLTPPTSPPTLHPQVSTTQVGTQHSPFFNYLQKEYWYRPCGSSLCYRDPRVGRGPFPKPRPVVLPVVRFGLPKPVGLGHIHSTDSDLMHHQYRLSILQWNPSPARRHPTKINSKSCTKPVITSPTSRTNSQRTRVIRTSPSCSTGTLLSPTVFAFQEASSSKDTWSMVVLVVRGLLRRPSLSGSPTVTFCSLHIHNVVAKKRDASADLLRRQPAHLLQHNVGLHCEVTST